jgi:hypothetical protein
VFKGAPNGSRRLANNRAPSRERRLRRRTGAVHGEFPILV